jgi:predicted TIM-barrel fold metal-dependent hydrolase
MVPDVGELLSLMDASNVSAIVNLDGMVGDELELNLDRYDRAQPGRFATFTRLDWRELETPGFTERLVDSVRRSAAAGAKGLKIWKDLGLHFRDHSGDLVAVDDPRLADVWEVAAELGLPIAIHTADPVAFFVPVDETNERVEELLEFPSWSFADRDRFPTFEQLIDAQEALVAAHPQTTFICVHVGNYPENLSSVARMLDGYPNFFVDVAARIAELGRQPRGARALIETYPDRVLFGTDVFPPTAAAYEIHWRFLETGDEYFAYSPRFPPPQGRWMISGLELSDETLQKVYAENARRLIPGLTP